MIDENELFVISFFRPYKYDGKRMAFYKKKLPLQCESRVKNYFKFTILCFDTSIGAFILA